MNVLLGLRREVYHIAWNRGGKHNHVTYVPARQSLLRCLHQASHVTERE